MDEMNKFIGTILAAVVWLAVFAISICIASIPKWNDWPVEEVRTILCYFMSTIIFAISPVGGGLIIYNVWFQNEKH
jgi:hypothetical protein